MLIACFEVPQIGIACERAQRPHLAECPVVLVQDTVVVVASSEAAAAHIQPGITLSGAKNLCGGLVALPYDLPTYLEAAQFIWDALAVESSIVEPQGAERCYALLSGPSILERIDFLRLAIAEHLAVPVFAGLGSSKLISLQAARHTPGLMTYLVEPEEELSFLALLKLSGIEQIDKETLERFARLGVETLGDLQAVKFSYLERQFKKGALRLSELARGVDHDEVRALWPLPAITEQFRFDSLEGFVEEEIDTLFIEHALSICSSRIGEKLQSKRTRAKRLILTLTVLNGEVFEQAERFERSADSNKLIYSAAQRLFKRIGITSPPTELTLSATDLGSGSGVQLQLLDERGVDYERDRRLNNLKRSAQRRFGLGALSEGVVRQPRQCLFYTYPLTHRIAEPVDVELDEEQRPIKISRVGIRGRIWDMFVTMRDIWIETMWLSSEENEFEVYRVESQEGGFYDLIHLQHDEWQLRAVSD